MDETPEELEQIRREADQIDVHQYKKRFRALAAIGLGSLAAGAVWLVLVMIDSRRTPASGCATTSATRTPPACSARPTRASSTSRCTTTAPPCAPTSSAQCQSKIDRLKEEDGVEVK